MTFPVRISDVQEEHFKWIRVTDEQRLPGVLLEGQVMNDWFGPIADSIIFRINARILGKELPQVAVSKTEQIKSPKNPWQHFKDMYADKWWMRKIVQKWPVKFVTRGITLNVEWDQWAVYPWIDKVPVTPDWQPVRVIMPPKTKVTLTDFRNDECL